MSLHRALGLVITMTLVVGCGNGAPAPAPSATATATAAVTATAAPTATSAAKDQGKKRWRGGRGVAGMMFHAAQDLELKDAQKATVEKLGGELRAGNGGPQPEMREYHATIVAQVRAGKIDTAKLDPLHAAVEKAEQARKDKEAETLNGLYAALEPAQRKALVAAVRAKQAEHAGHAGGPDKKADDPDWAKHHLEHLTKLVDLDAAQQKRVEPLIAKDEHPAPDAMRDEMKKHSDAVLTAFEADGFDAKKLEVAAPTGKKGPMAAHIEFLSAVLPILKPEQREKLAASMEKAAGHHDGPMGPGGGPGGGDDEHEEEAPHPAP